jgi:hypothetical protein
MAPKKHTHDEIINQIRNIAAIEMIKQNVPVDEIERITGVTLQTKFPEECLPNSSAAEFIKKGFESGLILGREEINNNGEGGQDPGDG